MPAQRNPPHSKRHQISRSFYSFKLWSIIKVCNCCFYVRNIYCDYRHQSTTQYFYMQ